MVQPIYATHADVEAAATGMDLPLPDDTTTWIRLASGLVTAATMLEFYPTRADGTPLDDDLAELFKAATVAQVLFWAGNGINPVVGAGSIKGTGETIASSIGSGRVQKASANTSVVQARLNSLSALVPAALVYLNGNGRPVVI